MRRFGPIIAVSSFGRTAQPGPARLCPADGRAAAVRRSHRCGWRGEEGVEGGWRGRGAEWRGETRRSGGKCLSPSNANATLEAVGRLSLLTSGV